MTAAGNYNLDVKQDFDGDVSPKNQLTPNSFQFRPELGGGYKDFWNFHSYLGK